MPEIEVTLNNGLKSFADTDMPLPCQTCSSREGWGCMEYFRGIESASLDCCIGKDCSTCHKNGTECLFPLGGQAGEDPYLVSPPQCEQDPNPNPYDDESLTELWNELRR